MLRRALDKYGGDGITSNGVDELRYLLLTSSVEVVNSAEEARPTGTLASRADDSLAVTVGIVPADGVKCERCWHYATNVGSSSTYPGVCTRCADALQEMNFPPVAAPAAAEAAATA